MLARSCSVIGVCAVLAVGSGLFLAPDPVALKVQGPDTIGNPVQFQTVGASGANSTQTFITSSASAGNAINTATLAGVAGKTTYITGFTAAGSGATAALLTNVTVAGTVSGSLTYTFLFPSGVNSYASQWNVQFAQPVPASAVNTAITVTLPAGGAGNTNATVTATGFQQ